MAKSLSLSETPVPIVEMNCAENNPNYFNYDVESMPEAKVADF